MLLVCLDLLGPLLEYYIQFWMPQMNMDYFENIYRRVERMVKPFVIIDGKRFFEELGYLLQRETLFIFVRIWGDA